MTVNNRIWLWNETKGNSKDNGWKKSKKKISWDFSLWQLPPGQTKVNLKWEFANQQFSVYPTLILNQSECFSRKSEHVSIRVSMHITLWQFKFVFLKLINRTWNLWKIKILIKIALAKEYFLKLLEYLFKRTFFFKFLIYPLRQIRQF